MTQQEFLDRIKFIEEVYEYKRKVIDSPEYSRYLYCQIVPPLMRPFHITTQSDLLLIQQSKQKEIDKLFYSTRDKKRKVIKEFLNSPDRTGEDELFKPEVVAQLALQMEYIPTRDNKIIFDGKTIGIKYKEETNAKN